MIISSLDINMRLQIIWRDSKEPKCDLNQMFRKLGTALKAICLKLITYIIDRSLLFYFLEIL